MDNKSKQIGLEVMWPLMEEQLKNGKKVIFMPRGRSMLPMLRQDIDKVVLDKPSGRLKKYDLPLYIRDNGQFVLHRVVKVLKDGYLMCGDNQFRREKIPDKNILALVTGYYHGDEFVPCDDKNYLKYCRKRVAWQHFVMYKMRIRDIIIHFFRLKQDKK